MLLASSTCTLLFTKQLWEGFGQGNLPLVAPLLAPVAFTAFLVIYTVDRWLLIRRRRYPMMRALVQIGVALVFLTWLIDGQSNQFQVASEQQAKPTATSVLLKHREARVRAAACELMGLRHETQAYEQVEALALGDRSDQVRSRCSVALEVLTPSAPPAPPPTAEPSPDETNQ